MNENNDLPPIQCPVQSQVRILRLVHSCMQSANVNHSFVPAYRNNNHIIPVLISPVTNADRIQLRRCKPRLVIAETARNAYISAGDSQGFARPVRMFSSPLLFVSLLAWYANPSNAAATKTSRDPRMRRLDRPAALVHSRVCDSIFTTITLGSCPRAGKPWKSHSAPWPDLQPSFTLDVR